MVTFSRLIQIEHIQQLHLTIKNFALNTLDYLESMFMCLSALQIRLSGRMHAQKKGLCICQKQQTVHSNALRLLHMPIIVEQAI